MQQASQNFEIAHKGDHFFVTRLDGIPEPWVPDPRRLPKHVNNSR